MVRHFKELADLHITKEEGITPDNIDKCIDVLLEIPKSEYGNNKSELSKLELLELYYEARKIFREERNTTRI